MKNFAISTVLIALVAFGLQQFFPWWTVAIAAFLIGYVILQKPFAAFLSGFVAVFALWALWSFSISSANEHLLAGKVAELLKPLTGGKMFALFLITGVIGGLVSGLAALTGRLAAQTRH